MSATTNIAWCDSTVNFWRGCTKVSSGCANCYAEALTRQRMGGHSYSRGVPRVKFKNAVKNALAMNRKPWICKTCGLAAAAIKAHQCHSHGWHRRRIFTNSLSDWLDDEVRIEWLAEMLDTIRTCDRVTWILCTKRPENWSPWFDTLRRCTTKFVSDESRVWIDRWYNGCPPGNVIVLTSVENQELADKRIPELLKLPAAGRGLSLEPLLGPVDLFKWVHPQYIECTELPHLDWLIIGGESGPKARPCDVDWIRSLVQQGRAAGVPVFVKQLGAIPVMETAPDGCIRFAKLRDKKGGDPSEWPEALRVHEWPKVSAINAAIEMKPSDLGDWKRDAKRMMRGLKNPCDESSNGSN